MKLKLLFLLLFPTFMVASQSNNVVKNFTTTLKANYSLSTQQFDLSELPPNPTLTLDQRLGIHQVAIKEGDLVIAHKKNEASNGDNIVCVYGEKVIIKTFFKQNDTITLSSLNSKSHSPIIIVDDYFKIEGVVKNVIKYS